METALTTNKVKKARPHLTWREAQGEARSRLYANHVFPSYGAMVREFYQKEKAKQAAEPAANERAM